MFISLLSLNVNNIQPGTRRFDRLVDLLLDEDPDLIALTECGPEAFESLTFELKPEGALYAPADYWGNGIISMRHPPQKWGSPRHFHLWRTSFCCMGYILGGR